MNPYVKTGIKGAILTLWCATVSVGVLLSYQSIKPPLTQTDLDTLEQKLQTLLTEQSAAQVALIDKLSLRIDAFQAEIDSTSQLVIALNGRYDNVVQRQDRQDQALSTFEFELDRDMQSKLRDFEAKLNRQIQTIPSKSRAVVTKPKENVTKQTPKPTIRAPFKLYDVQKRGQTYLAIVGSPTATQLSELRALQEGQQYQSWRFVHVEPGRVSLEKGEHRIEMEVRS